MLLYSYTPAPSSAVVTLKLTDQFGNELTTQISFGKRVRLVAETDGKYIFKEFQHITSHIRPVPADTEEGLTTTSY